MRVQRINIVVTVVLTILAVLAWARELYFLLFFSGPGGEILFVAAAFSVFACVGWVLVTVGSFRRDDETRCRKCSYILRGLTEPRCPECGEPI